MHQRPVDTPPGASGTRRWTCLSGPCNGQHPLTGVIERFLQAHPDAEIAHLPRWVASQAARPGNEARIFLLRREDGELLGYAPLLVHDSSLPWQIGELTLGHYRVRRWTLAGLPLLCPSSAGYDEAIDGFIAALREALGARDVGFLLGLPLDSPVGAALLTRIRTRRRLLAVMRSDPYQRRFADIAAGTQAYLERLGSRTRQDLRRNARRLGDTLEGPLRCERYEDDRQVPAFLEAAERISRLTYQWNLVGTGFAHTDARRRELEDAARAGWLRCYVLWSDAKPLAFMCGFLHDGRYYSTDIGYDPHYSKWSPGNVLHVKVIDDLTGPGAGVEVFDFLYGDNDNKARLATRSRVEQHIHLFPATARWRVLVMLWQATDRISTLLGDVLDRLGAKQRIRRLLRRRTSRS